jgi:integrase/recombinase XerD
VLTIEEVKLLFATCPDSILGKRNAVILVLYYSCGLRKAEGLRLKIEDIDLVQRQIFIRKSKTHQQRFVPMSKKSVLIIENYLFNAREFLMSSKSKESRLLLGERGTPISTELLPKILEKIIEKTKSKIIFQKSITLHKLRHSIATHLLANKMSLEDIAKFLGHKSLDSTQIYTHVATNNQAYKV